MSTESSLSLPICVIEPERKGWLPNLPELWRFRELFWVLVMRDITARYKQTYLGIVWAVLVPFAQVVIWATMFTLLGVSKDLAKSGVPFIVTSFCGNLVWQAFSSGANSAGGSIMGAAGMIKKVYFPRLIVPMSALVRALMDSLFMVIVLVLLMVGFHFFGDCDFTPTWRILFLPLFLGLAILLALGVGLWIAALTARWRDLGFVIPFIFQMAQFASPVIYEATVIPNQAGWKDFLDKHQVWFKDHKVISFIPWLEHLNPQMLFGLNPIAGIIEGFRWCLFTRQAELSQHYYEAPGLMVLVSVVVMLIILFSGLWFFRKTERTFVDIL